MLGMTANFFIAKGYKPNNGKNGRCKHYGYCYTQTEKELVIEI